jgi:hypothetical protein
MRAIGPGSSPLLLLDILEGLASSAIPYAIVGALAASYYGVPRFTDDADVTVWLGGTGKSPGDLKALLDSAGYAVKLSAGELDDPISCVLIVSDQHGNQVDILIGVRGMDPLAMERCESSILLGETVRLMGLEDLIAMKVFSGGPQDILDVRGILEVSHERLNRELANRLADRYGKDVRRTWDQLIEESGQPL